MSISLQAIALAEQGFHVFPLAENKKEPCFEGDWHDYISRDPKRIASLFSNPKLNVGIYAGAYASDEFLVIVDVDIKNGSPGELTFRQLEKAHGFPKTRVHRSPSGGRHHIYKTANQYAGMDLPGIEIITRGYIVGPGSEIDTEHSKGSYEVLDDHPIMEAPAWLTSMLRDHVSIKEARERAVEELDTEADIKRAESYLTALPEQSAGGRNKAGYKVACHLKDLAISETLSRQYMSQWNADKCQPPMSEGELDIINGSAYKTGQNKQGAKAARAEELFQTPFSPETVEAIGEANRLKEEKRKRLFYFMADDAVLPSQSTYLVKDVMDQEAMSVMYGESNSGKTFVMLDLAYHIAAGKPWQGRKLVQGAVVYVALEGGRNFNKRVIALHKEFGKGFPLAVVPCIVDLLNPDGDTKALAELILEAEKQIGQKVRLVVIDTLSRAMAGGNENGPEDMTGFVGNIDRLRQGVKAHFAIVHHTGKDKAKGARGHTALRAATDTEIEIADNTIRFTKQRDMEMIHSLGFALKSIELGVDTDGEAITSCIIEPCEATAAEDFKHQKDKEMSEAEKELKDLIDTATRGKGPIKSPALFKAFEKRNTETNGLMSGAKDTRERRRRMNDLLARLKAKGVVRIGGSDEGVSLTENEG